MWSSLEIDEIFLRGGQGPEYAEVEKRLLFLCLSAEHLLPISSEDFREFSPYLGDFVVLEPPPVTVADKDSCSEGRTKLRNMNI